MYYWTTYYSRLNTVFSRKLFVLIDIFRMTDLQTRTKNKTNKINKGPMPNKIQLVLEHFCTTEKNDSSSNNGAFFLCHVK
jgi:hypothetical protein